MRERGRGWWGIGREKKIIYMTPDNRNLIKSRDQRVWGQILTPSSFATPHNLPLRWCGDNECFTGRYQFWRWLKWLRKMRPARSNCLFIVVPDVVGNAKRTLKRYIQMFLLVKMLGYPAALAGQDGLEEMPWALRWLPYDALFVGGSTEWKMSPAADYCIRQAQRRDKWIHVGRVNSQKRIRHFKLVGVHSVDGTSLTYAPDRDFWKFQKALLQPVLFELEI